jgi:uncharacterized repeat protein (TIGR01451 family)
MRGYAPRLLRLFTLAIVFILFAPVQAAGRQNVEIVWSNDAPLGGYQLGDFDGDGKTDLFRITGTQWQYSSGGTGPWVNLANDAAPQNELRFGDFDGNGMTDVFHVTGNQWRYRPGGSGAWANLWQDTDNVPYTDLRFGDFNGDGRTDVFSRAANGDWRYSSAGITPWDDSLNTDATPLSELRFGYFDNDENIDIFHRRADGQWRFSSGGVGNWDEVTLNGAAEVPLSEMALGDFDGDMITDVFSRQPSGRWQYSKSGVDGWALLEMDPALMSELRFGDFDGDNITDVFSLGPGNQPRYSSGANDGWQNLVQAAPVTPMPPGPAITDIASLAFGDFNNDGITDVFRSNGGQWQYSSGGIGDWQNLNSDPLPLNQLRFGNFGGDGRTDVFSVDGSGQWRWSDGGVGNWQNLALDTLTIDQLRFGFFSDPPDNITDVFSRAPNGDWRFRAGGQGAWDDSLESDPLPLVDLAFADFDGNGITDVFSIDPVTGRGRYSRDARFPWANLDVQDIPLTLLRFGDFNGDGHDDIFTRTDSGQWRYLSAGLLPWVDVQMDPLSINDLRFGNFNGDNFTDVFSIDPNTGRWRYSSGAQSTWILLGPPGPPTPTFTPTPTSSATPTSTPTPTGSITPSVTPEGCFDILLDGDFEQGGAWIFGDSPVPGKYTGAFKQSGLRSVQLGITPEVTMVRSYSSIRQLLMVPANTSTVTLRWWQWAFSDEGANANPGSNQDRFEIIALTPGGDTLRVIHRTLRNDSGWVSAMVDVTELAGKSFYLYFNLYNDGHGGRSWIFLDNMMLEVCPGSGPVMMPGKPWDGQVECWPEMNLPTTGSPNMGGGSAGRWKNEPWRNPGKGKVICTPTPTATQTMTATATATMTPSPTITPTMMADLSLSKVVTPTIAEVDSVITFTVVITNAGLDTATGVVVSDDLPDGLDFGGSVASTGVLSGSFWTVGMLAAGVSETLQITATVLPTASVVISNYAQVWDSDQFDPDSTPGDNSPDEDDDDTATLFMGPLADLELTKTVTPTVAGGESEVVFTLIVTNTGPDIATGVAISDTFPPSRGFDYFDDSGGGAYDSGSGIWTVGMLAPGASATLVITAFVIPDSDLHSNYAQVWTSTELDPDSTPGDGSTGDDDDATAEVMLSEEAGILPPPQAAQVVSTPAPNAGSAAECIELIENGGFESSTGWTMSQGPAAPTYTTDPTFNDSGQAMLLGIVEGENMASISAIDQMVELPVDANSIILSFRYFPMFEEEPGPGDLQYVDIYNVMTGQFAGRALGTQANDRTWLTADYDLTMQAGQNVRLVLAVNNDGVQGRSAMVVDSISIRACNFGDLVNPGIVPTPDPALGVGNRSVADQQPVLLAGRESAEASNWLARLSAMGVLASVAGVIAFAVMVVIGTLRQT